MNCMGGKKKAFSRDIYMDMWEEAKFLRFLDEPVQDKSIMRIAGMNASLGQRMAVAGFDMATDLLGQFLVWQKNETRFRVWLQVEFDATQHQANIIAQNLGAYCEKFM